MNILLINHYAGSPKHGMEYRPYYLAREWVKAGHRVTIAAASASHVRARNPQLRGSVTEEIVDGIRYVWLRTPNYQGNGVRRVANIFSFVGQMMRQRGPVVNGAKPHAVIASSTYPLDIWPAARIARESGAKLVFEVHDLWPLTPIEVGGMSRWHPFIAILQWAEDFAYRRASRVVSILPKADDYMRQRGMAPEKFVHIPNGVDLSEWRQTPESLPEEHRAVIEREKSAGRFLVGYAGAHGICNALPVIVQAARQLETAPVTFLIVGEGPEKENLKHAAAGLGNVVLLPAVPKPAIPALLANLDALYIGLARQSLFRFGVSPNKLFDYMMAARPVIYAIDSGNDPVGESGCGISCGAEDPSAVAAAVMRLKACSPSERLAMGRRGRDYVATHHEYRILANRFLEVLA